MANSIPELRRIGCHHTADAIVETLRREIPVPRPPVRQLPPDLTRGQEIAGCVAFLVLFFAALWLALAL